MTFVSSRARPDVDQVGALGAAVLRRKQHRAMAGAHRRPARLAVAGYFRPEVGRDAVATAWQETRLFGRRHRMEVTAGVVRRRRRPERALQMHLSRRKEEADTACMRVNSNAMCTEKARVMLLLVLRGAYTITNGHKSQDKTISSKLT